MLKKKRMKTRFIFIVIFISWFTNGVYSSEVLRLGTYNIRIIKDTDLDDKAWVNRKEFVAKTITDNAYDVVAFQEVADKQQEDDLREILPDYTLVVWGRNSETLLSGERVGVAFLTNSFTLQESGFFFLSEDPTKPLVSWDSNSSRISVYVKLKSNATGEVFYYCSTHLDNVGTIARREGAKINVDIMRQKAGNFPCFIVGDFNAGPSETDVHNTMLAYFNDSRLVSQTSPIGSPGTLCGWSSADQDASRRIDFVYCNNVEVLTYETISDNYGRTATPSDHFPVIISCTLDEVNVDPNVYVSTVGDDQNDGSKEHPFRTIQQAILKASSNDTIKITEGIFYANPLDSLPVIDLSGTYMNKGLVFFGGLNNDFSRVTGMTTISGDYNQNDVKNEDGVIISGNEDNASQLIRIARTFRTQMENFIIEGAYSSETSSQGAAIQSLGTGVTLKNVIVRNNYSLGIGTGLYSEGEITLEYCHFYNNTAAKGAAIYQSTTAWAITLKYSTFNGNAAKSGSIAYLNSNIGGYVYGCSFYNNSCSEFGNFTYYNTTNTVSLLFVNNTFANNTCSAKNNALFNKTYGGSALYFLGSSSSALNLVSNTITGNVSTCLKDDGSFGTSFYGSAVNLRIGQLACYNNIIAANYSTGSSCGDVYVQTDGVLLASKRNLYTSADNSNISFSTSDISSSTKILGFQNTALTLDGTLTDSKFSAELTDADGYAPFVNLRSKLFEDKNICFLTKTEFSELILQLDMNNNGSIIGYLLTDQLDKVRNVLEGSAIGSVEFQTGTDVNSVNGENNMYYFDGVIHVQNTAFQNSKYKIYNFGGILIDEGYCDGGSISVSHLNNGGYIARLFSKDYTTALKFIK